jgi:hypothetical protein
MDVTRRDRTRRVVGAVLVLLLAAALSACSDDEADQAADEAREDLEEAADDLGSAVDDAGARVAAEAFAAAVDNDEAAADNGARDMGVIQENIDDLPGDPETTGIEDGDDDGQDDDGMIGFVVNDHESCVELSADSGEASVLDGPCP